MKAMNKKKKVVKQPGLPGARHARQGFLSKALAEKHLFQKKRKMQVLELKDEDYNIQMPGFDAAIVASKVDIEKVERDRLSIGDQLNKILEKIGKLYESAGFAGNVKASQEEEAAALHIANRPTNHDVKRLKNLKAEREEFLKVMQNFSTDSGSRYFLIQDVKDWLRTIDIADDLKTEEDYAQLKREHLESGAGINAGLSHALASIDEIKRIGYRLLADAGYFDQEDDVDQKSGRKRAQPVGEPPEKIYDTNDLLADKTGETFKEASDEVKRILQDTIRLVKTLKAKTMVRGGLKQYKYLMGATEINMERMRALEDKLAEKDLKVQELEAATANLTRLLDKAREDFQKIQGVLSNKAAALGRIHEENEVLKKKYAALELMTVELKEQLAKVPSKRSVSSAKEEAIKHVKSVVESVDSAEKLSATNSLSMADGGRPAEEVKQFRDKVENLEKEMRVLTVELEAERARSKSLQLLLQERLEADAPVESEDEGEKESQPAVEDEGMLEQEEEVEETMLEHPVESSMYLVTESSYSESLADLMNNSSHAQSLVEEKSSNKSQSNVSIKQKVKEKPQKSSPTSDHDMKAAISRLQIQKQSEINHLKGHMEKEHQRYKAAIRKLGQDHKDHSATIHKEIVHLLRAINRFKESVAQILEKEELGVAASEINRLENLPTEVNQQDPMMSLNRISGTAVELLVAMETQLAQALLNRHYELKDSAHARTRTSRQLNAKMEMMARLQQQHLELIEKHNAKEEELAMVKGRLTAVGMAEKQRYFRLSDRYQTLWAQNSNVQVELNNLKREFLEAMRRKEAAYHTAVIGSKETVKTIEDQQELLTQMQGDPKQRKSIAGSKFHMSMRSMRHNLIMLEDVLRDHHISRDLYQSAVDSVERAMMIPVIRLYHLFSRYIAFRRLTRFRDTVKARLEAAKEASLEACAMKCYLAKVESSIQRSSKAWQDRTNLLDKERRELFITMNKLFQDVLITTRLLKEQRTLKPVSPLIQPQCVQNFPSIASQQRSRKASVTAKTFFPRLGAGETLIGARITELSHSDERVWKPNFLPPVVSKSKQATIPDLDPRELELEETNRAAYPISYTEFYDYNASGQLSMAIPSVARCLETVGGTQMQHLVRK